jgi:hypothetical protein
MEFKKNQKIKSSLIVNATAEYFLTILKNKVGDVKIANQMY